jgi:hypothetical protein
LADDNRQHLLVHINAGNAALCLHTHPPGAEEGERTTNTYCSP